VTFGQYTQNENKTKYKTKELSSMNPTKKAEMNPGARDW
jgi:hypothetical protein